MEVNRNKIDLTEKWFDWTCFTVAFVSGLCDMVTEVKKVIHECNVPYTIKNEEKRNFGVGWQPFNSTNAEEHYLYRSPSELQGYPYWAVSLRFDDCLSQVYYL